MTDHLIELFNKLLSTNCDYFWDYRLKKYFIIYNLAFSIVGNILFSSIHHLNEHIHSDDLDQCIECLYFENNSNYTCCEYELSFLNNDISNFLLNDLVINKLEIHKKFHSRAPPTF